MFLFLVCATLLWIKLIELNRIIAAGYSSVLDRTLDIPNDIILYYRRPLADIILKYMCDIKNIVGLFFTNVYCVAISRQRRRKQIYIDLFVLLLRLSQRWISDPAEPDRLLQGVLLDSTVVEQSRQTRLGTGRKDQTRRHESRFVGHVSSPCFLSSYNYAGRFSSNFCNSYVLRDSWAAVTEHLWRL